MTEIIEHAGCQIEIWQDTDCGNPRDWDNLGTMVLFHRRYTLANELDLRQEDYSSWEELVGEIRKREGPIIWKAVHIYDHSGISLSTEYTWPFNCPWDASRIGLIYVTHAHIAAEYGKMTPETCLQAAQVLKAEVTTYSQWLGGECYGYTLTHDGEQDSCGGFIGYEHCLEEAKQQAECYTEPAVTA